MWFTFFPIAFKRTAYNHPEVKMLACNYFLKNYLWLETKSLNQTKWTEGHLHFIKYWFYITAFHAKPSRETGSLIDISELLRSCQINISKMKTIQVKCVCPSEKLMLLTQQCCVPLLRGDLHKQYLTTYRNKMKRNCSKTKSTTERKLDGSKSNDCKPLENA